MSVFTNSWTVIQSDDNCLDMISLRFAVGVIAIVGVSVCGLVGTFVKFEIVDRVNENLPIEQQYSWAGWHAGKVGRLFSDYRKFYPNGGLIRKLYLVWATGVGFLVLAAGAFRFFAK